MCVSLPLSRRPGELALPVLKLGFCSSLNFVVPAPLLAPLWTLQPGVLASGGEEGTPVHCTGLHPVEPQCLIGEVRLMVTISWDFVRK